jgi:hypothetical protein
MSHLEEKPAQVTNGNVHRASHLGEVGVLAQVAAIPGQGGLNPVSVFIGTSLQFMSLLPMKGEQGKVEKCTLEVEVAKGSLAFKLVLQIRLNLHKGKAGLGRKGALIEPVWGNQGLKRGRDGIEVKHDNFA